METVEKISSNIQNPISQMAEAASDLVEPKPQGIFSQFRNNKIVSGSKDFLESNSLVAKIVFILLVLILFIYLLRIMIIILHNLFGPVKNPILIDGIINGKIIKLNKTKVIVEDDKKNEYIIDYDKIII